MALRRVKITKKQDILVPVQAVDRLLDARDGRAALTYLYLLSCDGEFDDRAAASKLGMGPDDLSAALDILKKRGLTEGGEPPAQALERPDTIPEYTARDVADAIETDQSFSYLLEFTQKKLGKMLSTVDTQTLLGIYSWIGLPVDVICLLVTCCVDETRKKYGEGRRPTMRSIEQRARLWLNMGILTQAQAEEYLKEQERRGTRVAQLARRLHLAGRALSATESKYLTEWASQNFADELIDKAYDITVVKTGGLKWKYMDTILKSWHNKGYRTVSDVAQGEERRGPRAGTPSAQPKQEELDSVRKLREINRKRRGESQ